MEIVKLLLDHSNDRKIDLNAKSKKGRTAFMKACTYDCKKTVKLLLNHSKSKDIDLNAIDNYEETAFEMVCFEERFEIVELLHEHAIRKNIKIPEPIFSDAINDILKRKTRKKRKLELKA